MTIFALTFTLGRKKIPFNNSKKIIVLLELGQTSKIPQMEKNKTPTS